MRFDAWSECGVWAKLTKIDVGASSQKCFLSTRKSWIRHICYTTTRISQMGWRSFGDNFIVNGTVVHCKLYKEILKENFFSSWPFFTGVPMQIEDNGILMTKAFLGQWSIHSWTNLLIWKWKVMENPQLRYSIICYAENIVVGLGCWCNNFEHVKDSIYFHFRSKKQRSYCRGTSKVCML